GSVFGQPGRGGAGIELDAGATGGTDDGAGRRALEDDRVQAMRALEGHGWTLLVPTERRTFSLVDCQSGFAGWHALSPRRACCTRRVEHALRGLRACHPTLQRDLDRLLEG